MGRRHLPGHFQFLVALRVVARPSRHRDANTGRMQEVPVAAFAAAVNEACANQLVH
jgi:hypothetical protein